MWGTQHLALFVLSGLLLNITPGQDTFYILGKSLSHGRRAGLLSVLGISSGVAVHTLAAALGLSAILATSAHAFMAIKLVGAAYLAYLGTRMLLSTRDSISTSVDRSPESSWAIYRAGLLSNVLNPKVALFFLAFLPQFVAPEATSQVLPFLFLGAIFITNGTLWCLVLVWSASAMSRRLRANGKTGVWMRRTIGVLFVGLGVRLAVSR